MDTHPRYTIVGIIVLIILIALGLWVGWLWRGDSKDRSAFYAIYFRKQSLSGLQIDSMVTMRGIKVGTVKSVAIQPKDIERVRVVIALNYETPVRSDTRAVIARNLLTGLAGIDLIGSTQNAKPLEVLSGDNLAVIEEGQTGLDQFQQSMPEIIGKASTALDKIAMVLSDQNIETFSRALKNVERDTAALSEIEPVLKSADKTFIALYEILTQADGKVSPVLEDLAAAIKEIRFITTGLSSEISVLMRSIAATSEKLREPRSSVLGLPSGSFGPGEQR